MMWTVKDDKVSEYAPVGLQTNLKNIFMGLNHKKHLKSTKMGMLDTTN